MDYKERLRQHLLIYTNRLLSKQVREKEREDFLKNEELIKEYEKKKRRKRTVKKNIEMKNLNWYITLTINKNWKNAKDLKSIQLGLKQLFKYYKIDYYLIPELHKDNINYHFHGFISCMNDELIRRKKVDNWLVVDKYGDKIYELIPYERNYGYSSMKCLDDFDSNIKNKIINYIVKYAVKGGIKAMSSRSNYFRDDIISKTVEKWGELVVIE